MRAGHRVLVVIFVAAVLAPHRTRGSPNDDNLDPAALFQSGLQSISTFRSDLETRRQLRRFAAHVPAGKEVFVTLVYEKWSPPTTRGPMLFRAPEDFSVNILREVLPFQSPPILSNRQFITETHIVRGTGEMLAQGAPRYNGYNEVPRETAIREQKPESQLQWLQWNKYKRELREWQSREATRAPTMGARVDEETLTTVDAAWLRESKQVLPKLAASLAARPDPHLESVFVQLLELVRRATRLGNRAGGAVGGILFAEDAAYRFRARLDLDRVELDPATGIVTLIGSRSSIGVDEDLLVTALHIVNSGKGDLAFSLDPVSQPDDEFVRRRSAFAGSLDDRLAADPDFAARFRAAAFSVSDFEDRLNLVSFIDQLDPELGQEARNIVSIPARLRFEPEWLARTRFGELLYIADRSLKELAYGASAWTFARSRALALENRAPLPLNGFTRMWFTVGSRALATREVVDLERVNPVLQATFADTSDPIEGSQWAAVVASSVSNRFDDYARAFPEWEGLRQALRAYVAAVWIRRNAPTTAASLLARLPAPSPPSQPLPSVVDDLPLMALLDADGVRPFVAVGGGIVIHRDDVLAESAPLRRIAHETTRAVTREGDRSFLRLALPGMAHENATSSAIDLGVASSEAWIPSDGNADEAGYALFRTQMIRNRAHPLSWLASFVGYRYAAAFFLLAIVVVLLSRWRRRRPALPGILNQVANVVDVLLLSLIFVVVGSGREFPPRDRESVLMYWIGLALVAAVAWWARRPGRFLLGGVAFAVVLTLFALRAGITPAIGIWRPERVNVAPASFDLLDAVPSTQLYSLLFASEGILLGKGENPRMGIALLALLVAVLGTAITFSLRRQLNTAEREKRDQEEREKARAADRERWQAAAAAEAKSKAAAAEQHRRFIESNTLFGDDGESVTKAARRLGIEVVQKREDVWVARRGEVGYEVAPHPVKGSRAEFKVLDLETEDPVAQVKRLFGVNLETDFWSLDAGTAYGSFRVLARGHRDLRYDRQRYDGDVLTYVTVVDPLGRRFSIEDPGGVSYEGWER